jgi:penicillin-binding protein 2
MFVKTGTVQNNRVKNHSVFIGFAPRENPKIAIAVIVENGGYGGAYAAPIASFITEKYLTDSLSNRYINGASITQYKDANLLPAMATAAKPIKPLSKVDSPKIDSLKKKNSLKSTSKAPNAQRLTPQTNATTKQ